MAARKKPEPPPPLHYDLWRVVCVWDWAGAETWEEVGCKRLADYVGRFDSVEAAAHYPGECKIDGLYWFTQVESPPADTTQFMLVEYFEGAYI